MIRERFKPIESRTVRGFPLLAEQDAEGRDLEHGATRMSRARFTTRRGVLSALSDAVFHRTGLGNPITRAYSALANLGKESGADYGIVKSVSSIGEGDHAPLTRVEVDLYKNASPS